MTGLAVKPTQTFNITVYQVKDLHISGPRYKVRGLGTGVRGSNVPRIQLSMDKGAMGLIVYRQRNLGPSCLTDNRAGVILSWGQNSPLHRDRFLLI